MATSKRDMKHGTAHAKVAGDDEMLRTGFHNGTPLEAGKIADSEPVDLFASARGVAEADHASSQQQQQMRPPQQQEGEEQVAGGGGVASEEKGRQGMAAPTAGGRRLGRQ
ncbi:hypothetical protein EJB05_10326, partial [Eragrostis curvula]